MSNTPKFHKWLCPEEPKMMSGRFLMLPPEVFETKEFQNLTYASKCFYILLNVHKETSIQQNCLYSALTEYNQIYGLGMSDIDIQLEAYPRKEKLSHGYFVIPQKHLNNYGYCSAQYANKLKNELIKNGFIRAKYGGKGKTMGWLKNVTVYQFLTPWKEQYTVNHRFIVKRSPIVNNVSFPKPRNIARMPKYKASGKNKKSGHG